MKKIIQRERKLDTRIFTNSRSSVVIDLLYTDEEIGNKLQPFSPDFLDKPIPGFESYARLVNREDLEYIKNNPGGKLYIIPVGQESLYKEE